MSNKTTQIRVRDLSDLGVAAAIVGKAGRMIYDQMVKERGVREANLTFYTRAMQMKHKDITNAEVEDSLSKASLDQVDNLVTYAIERVYNGITVFSMPNDEGKTVFMTALTADEGSFDDPAKNIVDAVAEMSGNVAVEADGNKAEANILDLPVVVFITNEDGSLRPVKVEADITKLHKELAARAQK